MRVTAKQQEESVICTLPQGREIEIIMICAEGDDYHSEPDLNNAQSIIEELGRCDPSIFGAILDKV